VFSKFDRTIPIRPTPGPIPQTLHAFAGND
jgi:hypothetical protein